MTKAPETGAVPPAQGRETRYLDNNEIPKNQSVCQPQKAFTADRLILRRFRPFSGGFCNNPKGAVMPDSPKPPRSYKTQSLGGVPLLKGT